MNESREKQLRKEILEKVAEYAKEFHVDKATVKAALLRHDFKLRSTRSYKLCMEIRQEIVDAVTNGTPRKEVMEKYHISKSYLSQLLSGNRRI